MLLSCQNKPQYELLLVCTHAPAEVTVAKGSLSREPKNDIKNGTSEIWLIAFNALFDVSLRVVTNKIPHHYA